MKPKILADSISALSQVGAREWRSFKCIYLKPYFWSNFLFLLIFVLSYMYVESRGFFSLRLQVCATPIYFECKFYTVLSIHFAWFSHFYQGKNLDFASYQLQGTSLSDMNDCYLQEPESLQRGVNLGSRVNLGCTGG